MVQRSRLIELSYRMSIFVSTPNINPVGNGKDILRTGVCKCSFLFFFWYFFYALNLESCSCLIVEATIEKAIPLLFVSKKNLLSADLNVLSSS